jgi:hypothetical protein
MKRGSALFSKKFLRNAAIVLAIAVVAYVVMYGVKEGFQADNESKDTTPKEYKFNVYTNLSTKPINIPKSDYTGKTIKNIKLEVWAPATAGASANTKKEYIFPKFTNKAGGGNLIDRSFLAAQAAVYSKSGATIYNIRGSAFNPKQINRSKDIVIGPTGISGDDPRLTGGIFVFIEKSYANMGRDNKSLFEDGLYNAKVTLEFM